jgi:4-hydroxybenzoate polyprenyltransferase
LIRNTFKFIKRRILITCYLIVLIGSFYAGSVSINTFLAIFVLITWYLHAASSNDYADRKIDEVNLKGTKNRPLVTKSITKRNLWIVHILAGVASLFLSLIYGPTALLLTFVVLLISYAYSFKPVRITDRGIVSQLMLPIAYVLFPLSLGYWSADTANPYPWLLLAGLYTGFIARLMLKDFRDVKGDKMFGKRTFLLRHGRLATCYVSEFFGLISLIIMSFVINFSPGAFIVLVIGHVLASWFLRILSKTSQIDHQVKLVNTIAKTANGSVIVILSFYFFNMINTDEIIINIVPLAIGSLWYLYIWVSNKDDIQNKFA